MADNKKEVAVEKKSTKKPENKNKKPGLFKRLAKWFKETKSELGKVVWPSFKQVVNNTVVVLIIVIISAVFIGLFDALFNFLASFIV